jgi:hypothetical protein
MLYDNLADSAIVFSGITANLKTLAKAYERWNLFSQEAWRERVLKLFVCTCTYRSRLIIINLI